MNRILYVLTVLLLFTSCLEEPDSLEIDLSKYPKTLPGLQNDIWYLQETKLIHINVSNNAKQEYTIPVTEFPQHARWSENGNIFGYIDWDGTGAAGAPITLYDVRNETTVFTSQRDFVDFRLGIDGSLVLGDEGATTWYILNQNNVEVNFENYVNELFSQRNTSDLTFNNGIFKAEWISENQVKATVRGTQQDENFVIQQILADAFINTSNFPVLAIDEVVVHNQGFVANETGDFSFRIRTSSGGNILEVKENDGGDIDILDNGRINDVYFKGSNYLIYNKLNTNNLGDLVLNYYSVNLSEKKSTNLLPELYHRGSISHSPDGEFIAIMGLAGQQSKWQIFLTSISGADSAYVSNNRFVNSNPHFGPRF